MAQESESEDEEQAIYNPLKLPMGWDGKPIPYWLYKLHGLGQVGPVFSYQGVLNVSSYYITYEHCFPSWGLEFCILFINPHYADAW